MADKPFWYHSGIDNSNGQEVMLVFKGEKWIDVVSCSEYLERMRTEQGLLREREDILRNVSKFYDQYTFREYSERSVMWMREYSKVLNELCGEKFLIYNSYYSHYADASGLWNQQGMMWDEMLDGNVLEIMYRS